MNERYLEQDEAFQGELRDNAIRKISESVSAKGLDYCSQCDEPISAVRKNLGATKCMYCQEKAEQAGRLSR